VGRGQRKPNYYWITVVAREVRVVVGVVRVARDIV